MKVIGDAETAFRIGRVRAAELGFTGKVNVFSYPHNGSNLTLFAVELVAPDGKIIETIATQ